MLQLLAGIFCGAADYLLLKLYIKLLPKGDIIRAFAVLFAKLILLCGVLLAAAFLWRDRLWYTAVGLGGTLIIASIGDTLYTLTKKRKKEDHD